MYKPAFSLYSVQDKKEDPGPVIFKHMRVGKMESLFHVINFAVCVLMPNKCWKNI